MAKATTKPAEGEEVGAIIELKRLEQRILTVTIEGLSPLIVHRWSEKAKSMMLAAQTGTVRGKKQPKIPEDDFNDSRYRVDDKTDGFPAVGFKAAIVGAARNFEGTTMTALKSALFLEGVGPEQLVPIVGKPVMREDCVRVGQGTADLRYRAQYWPWSATLHVHYVASALSENSIVALVDAGGLGGVGEWRPSAPKSFTGSYGRFHVA